MSDVPDKPIGAPTDFGFTTAEEREIRRLAQLNLSEADREFQREQNAIAKERQRFAQQRAQGTQAPGVVAPEVRPPNLRYLLVAKMPPLTEGGHPVFKVVGFYTSRALLAECLGAAVMAYSNANSSLGVVDFDLNILQDQPAISP